MICSYPLSSVGMLLSANELGFKPKMFGGAMVGLQATAIKDKLKAQLNGVVNYENWVPSPKMMAPAADFFKKYQARQGRGVDPLGYYLGGWGYAYLQVLPRPSKAPRASTTTSSPTTCAVTRSTPSWRTASNSAKTANGPSAMMQVQYHDITDAANLETWRGMSYQTVLKPDERRPATSSIPTRRR